MRKNPVIVRKKRVFSEELPKGAYSLSEESIF
jgi:hypothetical protein